jgi:hypothetical protein
MDPDTSHSSTTRRGRAAGTRHARRSGSPPVARARRGPQIGSPAAPGGRAPLAPGGAQLAGQAKVGHQPASLGELGGAVAGKVLVPQDLGGAVPQGHRRLGGGVAAGLVAVVAAQLGGYRLAAGRRRRPVRGQQGLALPEGGERPVVQRPVLGAAEQRGPTGPVHRLASLQAHRGQRVGVDRDRTHRDVESLGPQKLHEPDGDLGAVSHRAGWPRGPAR